MIVPQPENNDVILTIYNTHPTGTTISFNAPWDIEVKKIPKLFASKYGGPLYDGCRLHTSGLTLPRTWKDLKKELPLTVTSGRSHYSRLSNSPLEINQNETFAAFYTRMGVSWQANFSLQNEGNNSELCVNDNGLKIKFRRTIRVPDDGNSHHLPPGLGQFPLFNVASFAASLPQDSIDKGGVFLPMYRMCYSLGQKPGYTD
jgi:hypothetical protein